MLEQINYFSYFDVSILMDAKAPELASNRHLASILGAYLRSEKWATERKFESEVTRNHSVAELHHILEDPLYDYLNSINAAKLSEVKKRFGV